MSGGGGIWCLHFLLYFNFIWETTRVMPGLLVIYHDCTLPDSWVMGLVVSLHFTASATSQENEAEGFSVNISWCQCYRLLWYWCGTSWVSCCVTAPNKWQQF